MPDSNMPAIAADIAILDDDLDFRTYLEDILADEKIYTIRAFATPAKLFASCEERVPDIVLLDIIMPDMDGFEVLQELRSFTDIPVIAFSASPANEDQALALGADDFVHKPFDSDDMARRIRALLSKKISNCYLIG